METQTRNTTETAQQRMHEAMPAHRHHRIVIIGGGTAGITVAARLIRQQPDLDVAVIEPSAYHYYQPMWTLIAGGIFPKERSQRLEASVMPKEATWIQQRVTSIDPDRQTVTTDDDKVIGYEYLVVAPGIQIDWDLIPGLQEHLGQDGICSIYDYQQAERTWEMLRNFKGGQAIFTSPGTPIKCGGAPQKIMYLADDLWRKTEARDRTTLSFATAGSVIFGVRGFRERLEEIVARKNIQTYFKHDLIELRPDAREAVFRVTTEEEVREVVLSYDLIHVTPPMSAPDFIKVSKLAYQEGPLRGWLKVDEHTLKHRDYNNVFGLGDVAGIPTAKTGAAIRKQAPVVVSNLLAAIKEDALDGRYDGYSSCPLVTGYGKMVLAEFAYGNEPVPSFPFDTTKERFSMYLLKLYGLPFLYWNLMLRGRA